VIADARGVTETLMKFAEFELIKPKSPSEVSRLLNDNIDGAKILAGGQSLLPLMALRLVRPALLIDITGLDAMSEIAVNSKNLEIGALVTHRQVELFHNMPEELNAISMGMRVLGHIAIRNRGTVAGSLAHCDPHAEWPALILGLDGYINVEGVNGPRRIQGSDFSLGWYTSSLLPDEIITSIGFPLKADDGTHTTSYMSEYSLRHGDFALAGVVIRLSAVGDRISDARCVVFGIAATAERLNFLEDYLNQSILSEDPTRDVGNIVKQILIENNMNYSESLSDSYCIQYLIPNLFTDGIRAAVANLKISKNL